MRFDSKLLDEDVKLRDMSTKEFRKIFKHHPDFSSISKRRRALRNRITAKKIRQRYSNGTKVLKNLVEYLKIPPEELEEKVKLCFNLFNTMTQRIKDLEMQVALQAYQTSHVGDVECAFS
jgi:hypothetical protein